MRRIKQLVNRLKIHIGLMLFALGRFLIQLAKRMHRFVRSKARQAEIKQIWNVRIEVSDPQHRTRLGLPELKLPALPALRLPTLPRMPLNHISRGGPAWV